MTALLAIPLLGEVPSTLEWSAVALVCVGVYFVTRRPAT
jgi:drug/metabolite transporter (DMT)-like permease